MFAFALLFFSCFNSNMVRLKDVRTIKLANQKLLFQFQYGSIKSPILVLLVIIMTSFNSNMVRLKGKIRKRCC